MRVPPLTKKSCEHDSVTVVGENALEAEPFRLRASRVIEGQRCDDTLGKRAVEPSSSPLHRFNPTNDGVREAHRLSHVASDGVLIVTHELQKRILEGSADEVVAQRFECLAVERRGSFVEVFLGNPTVLVLGRLSDLEGIGAGLSVIIALLVVVLFCADAVEMLDRVLVVHDDL